MRVFTVAGSFSVKVGNKFAVVPVSGKIVASSVNDAAQSESMRVLLQNAAIEHARKNQGNKVPTVGRDFMPEKGMVKGLTFTAYLQVHPKFYRAGSWYDFCRD